MTIPTISCYGKSGKQYIYEYCDISKMPNFPDVAGNYVFMRQNKDNTMTAVYFGITNSFAERFDNHHAMPCIKRNGATHIGVHENYRKADREAEESDLLASYNTSCNIQQN